MKQILLDLQGAKDLTEIHQRLKNVFELPEYYSNNMDALWDCLYCLYDMPVLITIKGLETLPENLSNSVDAMLKVFSDLQKSDTNIQVQLI